MFDKKSIRAIVINGDKLLAMKRDKFGKQYYTLIGGKVEIAEDKEVALRRELREEAGMEVGNVRLVFVEDGGDLYGPQYVYLCDYVGGDPVLSADSIEAKINVLGKNTYEPIWLPLAQLTQVPFRSSSVAEAVLDSIQNGFPEKPRELAWKPETVQK